MTVSPFIKGTLLGGALMGVFALIVNSPAQNNFDLTNLEQGEGIGIMHQVVNQLRKDNRIPGATIRITVDQNGRRSGLISCFPSKPGQTCAISPP